MANTIIKGRVQNKSGTSAEWALATTFIPLNGEVIVYSDVHKIKVGDGQTLLSSLPFLSAEGASKVAGLSSGTTENHVVTWGANGFTVKDGGHTLAKDVPADAVFTDTHYTNTLDIKANGTSAVTFSQDSNKTLNIKGSGSTTVSKTADGEITVSSTGAQPNDGKLTLKVAGATKTEFTANQSTNAEFNVTAADLGLSQALVFKGITKEDLTDGSTTSPIEMDDGTFLTPSVGNVVITKSTVSTLPNTEFVWANGKWNKLGDAKSYKLLQTPVSDPTASGYATAFVDSISQSANGDISVTKKNIPVATTSANGLMSSSDKTKLDGIDISGKADKVTGATAGHLASLDSNGNLTDSGKSVSDFTDTKVTQTLSTENTDLPVLIQESYIPSGWVSASTIPYDTQQGFMVTYNNEVHILGGAENATAHYKYNGTSWISVSTLPYDFVRGSAVVYNNEIHLMGGDGDPTAHYKYTGTSWTSVSTLPQDFYTGSAVVYNDEIHIMGSGTTCTSHYKYNGTSWNSVSTLPYGFYDGSSVVYNNEIHLMGGAGDPTAHYKYTGTSWISVSTLPFEHNCGAGVVYNNAIHLMCSNHHYKYNGTTWTNVSTFPFSAYYVCVAVCNNAIHITVSTSHYKYGEPNETSTSKYTPSVTINPSTGNLNATKLNGTTIGSSPKFTDTITTATTTGQGNAVTSIEADANGSLTVTKGITFSLSNHTHAYAGAIIPNGPAAAVYYTTTAPISNNPAGIRIAVLTSEPATKYDGWLYIITEA